VLEVGPAVGNQLDRFDKAKVDHIWGVEPNPEFVVPLLAKVEEAGLQGKYTLLLGRVEDEELLAAHGIKEESIDSIVCIHSLCSIDNPEQTMRWMWKLLKPGGVFIFWEHQRSYDFWTRLVQSILPAITILKLILAGLWNPLWNFSMAGCNLTWPIGEIVKNAGAWDLEASTVEENQDPTRVKPRVEGRMVKQKRT
jgi:SAM-dependent methyltransferase